MKALSSYQLIHTRQCWVTDRTCSLSRIIEPEPRICASDLDCTFYWTSHRNNRKSTDMDVVTVVAGDTFIVNNSFRHTHQQDNQEFMHIHNHINVNDTPQTSWKDAPLCELINNNSIAIPRVFYHQANELDVPVAGIKKIFPHQTHVSKQEFPNLVATTVASNVKNLTSLTWMLSWILLGNPPTWLIS